MRIPQNISLKEEGQYCLECFSKNAKRVFRDNLTYYHCDSCNKILERSLVIDNRISWWVDKNSVYWHESVGVLVIFKDTLFTFLRKIYPFSHTIPAGHLDKGELPEAAARRELFEETGISTDTLEVIKRDFAMSGDSCRRGSDDHRWHLYRIKLASMPKITLCDEASSMRFMTLPELRIENNLTYPLKIFVDEMGKRIFL